jgi:hypothetical protein
MAYRPLRPARAKLIAELWLGEPTAVDRFLSALLAAGGSLEGVAASLGLSVSTVNRLRAGAPAIRALYEQHGLGRTGAASRGTAALARRSTG